MNKKFKSNINLPVVGGLVVARPVLLTSAGDPVGVTVGVLVSPALAFAVGTLSGGFSGGGGLGALLGLLFVTGHEFLGVSPEEGIDHDVPLGGALHGAAEIQDLTGEHPVDEGDGFLTLVVHRDGNINVLQRRVGVTQSDDGDVHVAGLLDGLGIGTGIGDDQQTGLSEVSGDIIGQGTGGPATGARLGADVLRALQDGTGTIGSLRADQDVLGVLSGDDDTGSGLDLLPGLHQVDDVDTGLLTLESVVLHGLHDILGSQMGLADQHLLDVLLAGLLVLVSIVDSSDHGVK